MAFLSPSRQMPGTASIRSRPLPSHCFSIHLSSYHPALYRVDTEKSLLNLSRVFYSDDSGIASSGPVPSPPSSPFPSHPCHDSFTTGPSSISITWFPLLPIFRKGRFLKQTQKANHVITNYPRSLHTKRTSSTPRIHSYCAWDDHILCTLPRLLQSTFISCSDTTETIKGIKPKKTPGDDTISNKTLKSIPNKANFYIQHTFQACIDIVRKNAQITTFRKPESAHHYYKISIQPPTNTRQPPWPYIVSINGIPDSRDTKHSLLADDTALLAREGCALSAMQKLQRHTSLLEQWLTKWRICMKLDKIVAILLTRRLHERLSELCEVDGN
jgi:hypothetical protein